MDENDESLVFVTIWDCWTHVPMTLSVERTDLDFKISVALVQADLHLYCWHMTWLIYIKNPISLSFHTFLFVV